MQHLVIHVCGWSSIRLANARCDVPDRVDVALAILTLVLAVVAMLGRVLVGVLVYGERLLLALRGRREVVMATCPTQPNRAQEAATTSEGAEQRPRHPEACGYALARLRDLVVTPAQH
jgi:hypothetical protein